MNAEECRKELKKKIEKALAMDIPEELKECSGGYSSQERDRA